MLQIAKLTDQREGVDADVVAAELRATAADRALMTVRARMRDRAVAAYVRGRTLPTQARAAPAVYLAVAAAKESELQDGYRAIRDDALDTQARAELLRDGQHRDEAGLGAMRGRLDEAIAVDDARRAEAERAAQTARARALAAREGFLATARGRARAGLGADTPSPGGYDPVPLDPAALLPRHFAATAAQQAMMARWPFGPIQPGAPLPAGLHPTGTHVEGIASWYGPDFDGRPTASGAIYDMEGWTIASPDLPLGSFLVVANGDARVLLLVNDRGPYVPGRVLDLSHAAAAALGVSLGYVTADVVAP